MYDREFLRLFTLYLKHSFVDAATNRTEAADRLYELAEEAEGVGHVDLGVRCLERAAELHAKPSGVYAALGSLRYRQGQYEKARDAFDRARATARDDERAHLDAVRGLAMSYHMLGNYARATYYYVAVLAVDREDFESRLNLGLTYHLQGRLEDAVEQLSMAAELGDEQDAPIRYYAHLSLGKALYDCARFEEAEASLERAIEVGSSQGEPRGEPYFYLGLTQEVLDRPQDAADSYRKAVEIDPDDAYAHLRLGDLYAGERNGREAVEHGNSALRLFERYGPAKERGSAYLTIGWGHYLNSEWEQSAAASREALALDPTLVPVRFNLGLALLRQGREDEARRVYEEAAMNATEAQDLESHGIADLEAALREDPDIEGAPEILDRLRAKRRELAADDAAEPPTTVSDATAELR